MLPEFVDVAAITPAEQQQPFAIRGQHIKRCKMRRAGPKSSE